MIDTTQIKPEIITNEIKKIMGIPISDITVSLAYLKRKLYVNGVLKPKIKKKLRFRPEEITSNFIKYFNEYLRALSKRKNPLLTLRFLLAHLNEAYLKYTFLERHSKDFTRILKNKQLFDEKFRSGLEANISYDNEIKRIEDCQYCWFCNFNHFSSNDANIFKSSEFKFAGPEYISFCNRKDCLFPIEYPNEMVCNRWEIHLAITEELNRRTRIDQENLLRDKSRERERSKTINLECM